MGVEIGAWLLGFADFCDKFAMRRHKDAARRSDVLDKLMVEYKLLDIDGLFVSKSSGTKCDDTLEELCQDDGANANEILLFLTKVCYRKANGIIAEDEFQFFKGALQAVMKNTIVCNWIADYHARRGIGLEASPYLALLDYCTENGMVNAEDLLADGRIKKPQQLQEVDESAQSTIRVSDGKKYATHLDVLNGIFNKGLLFHMSGGSPLDANTLIWFPHIRKDGDFVDGRMWNNTLSADGMELRECCNDAARFGGNVDAPKVKRRYVFATFDGERERCYRFKGIFEFVKNETANPNEIRWLYRRVADSFDAREFA